MRELQQKDDLCGNVQVHIEKIKGELQNVREQMSGREHDLKQSITKLQKEKKQIKTDLEHS